MLVIVDNRASHYTDIDVERTKLITNEIWNIVQPQHNIDALSAAARMMDGGVKLESTHGASCQFMILLPSADIR